MNKSLIIFPPASPAGGKSFNKSLTNHRQIRLLVIKVIIPQKNLNRKVNNQLCVSHSCEFQKGPIFRYTCLNLNLDLHPDLDLDLDLGLQMDLDMDLNLILNLDIDLEPGSGSESGSGSGSGSESGSRSGSGSGAGPGAGSGSAMDLG